MKKTFDFKVRAIFFGFSLILGMICTIAGCLIIPIKEIGTSALAYRNPIWILWEQDPQIGRYAFVIAIIGIVSICFAFIMAIDVHKR